MLVAMHYDATPLLHPQFVHPLTVEKIRAPSRGPAQTL